MSDYRPVRRSASGEGKHVWQLLHVASGEMAGGSQRPTTFGNKGEAVVEGRRLTAHPPATEPAEPAENPYLPEGYAKAVTQAKPKRKAAARGRPAATGKGKGTRAKRTSARSKGGGMSPPRG